MAKRGATKAKRRTPYEECLVTFIDILGFRNLLETKSAKKVRKALDVFRRETAEPDDDEPRDPTDPRPMSEVKLDIVSDAVVRARTIHTRYRDGALFHELLDLVHIQAACIQNGILIRGALTIDKMHLGKDLEGPVFGPGLVKAYQMEEREAVYPRIIVDENVIDRFLKDKSLRREGHTKAQEAAYVDRMLKADDAGLMFVDYLRAIEPEIDDPVSYYISFLPLHKKVIDKGLAEGHRREVRRKYVWLRNYHNREVEKRMDTPNLDEPQELLGGGTLRSCLEPLIIS